MPSPHEEFVAGSAAHLQFQTSAHRLPEEAWATRAPAGIGDDRYLRRYASCRVETCYRTQRNRSIGAQPSSTWSKRIRDCLPAGNPTDKTTAACFDSARQCEYSDQQEPGSSPDTPPL